MSAFHSAVSQNWSWLKDSNPPRTGTSPLGIQWPGSRTLLLPGQLFSQSHDFNWGERRDSNPNTVSLGSCNPAPALPLSYARHSQRGRALSPRGYLPLIAYQHPPRSADSDSRHTGNPHVVFKMTATFYTLSPEGRCATQPGSVQPSSSHHSKSKENGYPALTSYSQWSSPRPGVAIGYCLPYRNAVLHFPHCTSNE